MREKWPTHLFEYRHEGATWSLEIPARSADDAKRRIEQLKDAQYLGTLEMKIPVELGVFARIICWLQNIKASNFS